MGKCDRSSVVTDRSFFLAACKLRAIICARVTRFASALLLDVLLKPAVCLRLAQNRPYLDRNTYSGQYGKMASHKPRRFDLPSLRAIQTNVCIGR
jgi:hypothetical protein